MRRVNPAQVAIEKLTQTINAGLLITNKPNRCLKGELREIKWWVPRLLFPAKTKSEVISAGPHQIIPLLKLLGVS